MLRSLITTSILVPALLGSTSAVTVASAINHRSAHNNTITVTVMLPVEHKDQLAHFIDSLYNTRSAQYHHFLTPAAFTAAFAPSTATYQRLATYLRAKGLHIQESPNRLVIDVTGDTVALTRAFGSRSHSALSLPTSLRADVSAVIGWHAPVTLRPHLQWGSAHARLVTHATPSGYTPSQIASAYNVQGIYHTLDDHGWGQTIAVATADTFPANDLRAFDAQFQIAAPKQTVIPVDGTATTPDPETALDVEWSHALSVKAALRVYEAATPSLTGFTDVYNRIANDDIAKIVTTSWGLPESQMPLSTIQADHAIFAQMAAEGITIVAASGDSGAYDGTNALTPDYPASDPYVLAAGGTSMQLDASNQIASESAWSSSGGGESNVFPLPSWQRNIQNIPVVDNSREVPDFALNADPNTGYAFIYQGQWNVAGGTSFVAPLMASTLSLIDEARYFKHEGTLGLVAPALYAAATSGTSPFHDIVSGNNGYYQALSGYDNTTGLGSFDALQLLYRLS